MLVTPAGIISEPVRPLQWLNAQSPIFVRLFGIVTLISPLQP